MRLFTRRPELSLRLARQGSKGLVISALLAPILGIAIALVRAEVPGVSGDTTADSELGQVDFIHSTAGFVRPQALNLAGDNSSANGVAIDEASGHVYVVDPANARVLGWPSASGFHNDSYAQPDGNSADAQSFSAAPSPTPTAVPTPDPM